jgi:hypothetical protein
VSTPGQGGEGPRYDPYGQQRGPGGGAGPQQGGYGSPPPYGQPSQYAYNPYTAAPYPAGTGGEPQRVKRPGIMVLSLVLLALSALPFLFFGVVLLAVPAGSSALQILLDSVAYPAGTPADQQVLILRIVGGLSAGFAALYILFAALAFTGRNWARIAVTVLTAGFVLLLVAGLVQAGGGDVTSLGLVLVVVALSVVGTLVLYLTGPRAYFARPRR